MSAKQVFALCIDCWEMHYGVADSNGVYSRDSGSSNHWDHAVHVFGRPIDYSPPIRRVLASLQAGLPISDIAMEMFSLACAIEAVQPTNGRKVAPPPGAPAAEAAASPLSTDAPQGAFDLEGIGVTTPPAEYVDLYGHRPLPEYRPSDPEAHRATIEAKRAANKARREADEAARASQTPQALARAAQTKAPREPKPQGNPVKPCTGPCKRPTRPHGTSLADHPDTITRVARGMCNTCYQGGPKKPQESRRVILTPCEGTCGRMTRPGSRKASEFPFHTVVRAKGNLCRHCASGPKGRDIDLIRPCSGCGELTRPRGPKRAAQYPDVKPRISATECTTCYERRNQRAKRARKKAGGA